MSPVKDKGSGKPSTARERASHPALTATAAGPELTPTPPPDAAVLVVRGGVVVDKIGVGGRARGIVPWGGPEEGGPVDGTPGGGGQAALAMAGEDPDSTACPGPPPDGLVPPVVLPWLAGIVPSVLTTV